MINPLQELNQKIAVDEALKQVISAEEECQSLYTKLSERTKAIADQFFIAEFVWRVRVGGIRGFDEILLPVFHPVYGIPYIPSASIKGAVKAWAKKNHSQEEVYRLLGDENKESKGIGCVQFLDAFPTEPCLSIDVVNPQWRWQNQQVSYKSDPHFFLSMEEPEIIFGLTHTSRGNLDDVIIVKEWLEQALSTGIGSRVSAGYGRASKITASLPYSSSHKFQLWTQGIYGASEIEFRPTALRGMLRYWFRAIAFGLYSLSSCKALEADFFGTIEPKAKEGHIRIGVDWKEKQGNFKRPHHYEGTILLEAKQEKYLTLVENILKLASHLGGIGRGSRRPLHWNYPRFRGCHWELDDYILPCDRKSWQKFMQEVVEAFVVVQPIGTPGDGSPGEPGARKQDVLNNNAKIYLVPSYYLRHPEDVNDWQQEGKTTSIRGETLDSLYDNRFKTKNVGGSIKPVTPSYVLIQSNFPYNDDPYQAVTIFGAEQRERAAFCQEIEEIGGIKIDW